MATHFTFTKEFQLRFRDADPSGIHFTQGVVPQAEIRRVHVVVNPQTMKKTPMPLQVREFLKVYADVESSE